ncbi:Importin subunit alpha-1 [Camelus dromedarius]|uniref:Importin subunit alpha-1 n=1 Tax=Camelus dromedarius TaxID=9838 RepID=A0A5N4DKH9_CAMDR|nr:Importin subunit alpha-1 [Camelus dromedarius]
MEQTVELRKAQEAEQLLPKSRKVSSFLDDTICHCKKLNEQRQLVSWSLADLVSRMNSNNRITWYTSGILLKFTHTLTKAASGLPDQNKAVEDALTAFSVPWASPQAHVNEQTMWTLRNIAVQDSDLVIKCVLIDPFSALMVFPYT